MNTKHVSLDLPTVVGMGISGPVLAFLTASMYTAFRGLFGWSVDAYAVIMFCLSAMLAAFPAIKSKYHPILKLAMWPVATVMIFATAWGSNTGMSAGEDAIVGVAAPSITMAMAPSERIDPLNPMEIPTAWTNGRPEKVEIRFMTTSDSESRGRFFKRLR